jgi:hypothetical protein
VLTLAALLSFAGAVLALWLVREHEIQRPPIEPKREPKPSPKRCRRPPRRKAGWSLQPYMLRGAIGAKREYWPWKVTATVSVGPLRCLARIRSASPLRGDSWSYSSSR